jgi:GTP-binding protein HflX
MHQAIIVQPNLNQYLVDYDYKMQEAINLAKALDLDVCYSTFNKIKDINPAFFLTKGFLDSLKEQVDFFKKPLVIVNYDISAVQQRNLEKFLGCAVIDRTNLIINIFEKRAQSKEGKLQAELARALYQKSKLVRAWTHLERQRGGGGFIGGPGETQKELDRRMLELKIESIKKDLIKITQDRKIQKNKRQKFNLNNGVLVGYTNSGKSTLFNTLTKATVVAKDLLFATLDPTTRNCFLQKNLNVILSDTVGFISDIPHQLIIAFKSTLEEVQNTNFILHVIDVSNSNYLDQIDAVKKTLKELQIDENIYNKKVIEVYNKIDKLNKEQLVFFKNKNKIHPNTVLISAKKSTNIDELKNKILNIIKDNYEDINIKVNFSNYKLVELIYNYGIDIKQKALKDSWSFKFLINKANSHFIKNASN